MSSLYATGYARCQTCGVIDRDIGRLKAGYACTVCGKSHRGGLVAFHVGILILIDLVHESFHSSSAIETEAGPQVRRIGTVLYFCALREALMNWFIHGQLNAQKVPDRISDQLISDNKMAHQKFGSLFTSVTGDKWIAAIARVSKAEEHEFSDVSRLMIRAAELRNDFLHNGSGWDITEEFSEACFKGISSLVFLFVALHNLYTHPFIRSSI